MGNLFILVGPSGVGKTTQVELLKQHLGVREAISHTARPQRPEEIPGVSYFYVSQEEFDRMKAADAFVETVVYPGTGKCYGSSRIEVESKLALGNVVIVAEGNGAIQFLEKVPGTTVIFLLPPSKHEQCKRIILRNLLASEPQKLADIADLIAGLIPDIEQRMAIVDSELEWTRIAHYQIQPGTIEEVYLQIAEIIKRAE